MVIELSTDWEPRQAPPFWRPSGRSVLLAGLVVSLLLISGLAGSSTGSTAAYRLVASVPGRLGSTCVLAGDRLFVMTPQVPSGGVELTAYSLPGARRLWRETMASGLQIFPTEGPSDVVLAAIYDESVPQFGRYSALDAATGRVLWSLPKASPIGDVTYNGGRMLFSVATGGEAGELRLIDLRSGSAVWSHAMAPQTWARGIDGGRVMVEAPDGGAQTLDRDSGRLLTSGKLAVPRPDPDAQYPDVGPAVFPVSDQVVVTDPGNGHTTITSYDLDTLAVRWHTDIADAVVSLADCGPVLCVNGNSGVTAIDPATAERRWTSATWAWADVAGRWLLAGGAPDRPDESALLDPATGQTVMNLATWSLMSSPTPGKPTLVIGRRSTGGGTWLGSLRGGSPRGGALRVWPEVLLPGVIATHCTVDETGSTYLACATLDGPVRLWASN